ncbi:DUF4897 domain-containing protein [Halobacteria archaeon AArc-dxtr1]|nr:DUF4897 domain-containing protein [Halobacteria archaeon AArc-dxtr1]
MDVWGLRALLCVVVVTGCVVAVGPVAVAAEPASGVTESAVTTETLQEDEPSSATVQEDVSAETTLENADEISVRIDITENGSATLRVDYRYELEGNASVDWEAIEDDVDANPDEYISAESEGWQATIEQAENETDREMDLSNGNVTTDRSHSPVELGHLRFQFDWSSFASVELNRIEAGDALTGFTLVDRAQLTLSWPDGYEATAIEPGPTTQEETSVTWNGEQSPVGEDGHPQVELIESGSSSADPENEPIGGELIWWSVVVVLGGVGIAVFLVARRSDWQPGESNSKPTEAGPATGPEPKTTQTPPPELLSNEERVLQLLEQHGGRLKQQQVVTELEWTEAKTSQVVSGLRTADEIDVFRIGRENVLVLPEDED